MRRFDKKKNIANANLLAESRYLASKGLISEMFSGAEIDIDGITDALVATTLHGGDDNTVYLRAKDSLVDSDDKVKSDFYNMLAAKMEANNLTNQAQQYRSIAQQYIGGLQEEEEIGEDFWSKYNTSTQDQKQICWNMIQHFKGFENALKENVRMRDEAMRKGVEYADEVKLLNYRIQYMENNRDLLDTTENPFFQK